MSAGVNNNVNGNVWRNGGMANNENNNNGVM
jgi:hypothetical protein